MYTRGETICSTVRPIAAELPLRNLRIRLLCTDLAQATYDSAVTYNGVIEYAHRSSIWSRTATDWVMRFHQGTPYVP